jgi:hypothetical protein
MQAALEPAGGEKWHGVRRLYRLGVQDVTEIDSGQCSIFCSLGEKEKKKKKKNKRERERQKKKQSGGFFPCLSGWLFGEIKG